jgi:hypothetical protein
MFECRKEIGKKEGKRKSQLKPHKPGPVSLSLLLANIQTIPLEFK